MRIAHFAMVAGAALFLALPAHAQEQGELGRFDATYNYLFLMFRGCNTLYILCVLICATRLDGRTKFILFLWHCSRHIAAVSVAFRGTTAGARSTSSLTANPNPNPLPPGRTVACDGTRRGISRMHTI